MTGHSRRAEIAPFYVMEVMKAAVERERAGGEVLHMEVGQPSTPAPRAVIDAAIAALTTDRLGYTSAMGILELRERIARFYVERHGVRMSPEQVVVTVGASAGCVLSFLAAFDAGDRVAVAEPGYPCYRNMLEAFGIDVVGIPVGRETRYALTPDLLSDAGAFAGVVIGNPANPTGTAYGGEGLAELVEYCATSHVRLISDEIYQGIEYDNPATTVAALTSQAIVLQSFSKYYSMTGWRLGWLIAPEDLRAPIERLAQNLFISPPTLSQLAALAAFECKEELDANVARYARNRAIVIDGLNTAGIRDMAPADGAFYVYADVSHLTGDSQDLCARWLSDTGVAVTPGVDFDPVRGHRFVRFSYSESTEDVTEAMQRITRWCRRSTSEGSDRASAALDQP